MERMRAAVQIHEEYSVLQPCVMLKDSCSFARPECSERKSNSIKQDGLQMRRSHEGTNKREEKERKMHKDKLKKNKKLN